MVKSLYIHIPFCRRRCLYCDFYSIEYSNALASVYVDILCSQIGKLPNTFETIYIGGGTPSILSAGLWEKLLIALKKCSFGVGEFSIEANPESLDEEKIGLFIKFGVNRLSIGVQSLCNNKLRELGRVHNVKEAVNKILLAKKTGFDNIGIDLIFGVSHETFDNWAKELKEAVKLPIVHISTYFLTYEKNTPLFERVKKGKVSPSEDALVAQMYKHNIEYLPKKGFLQYEISNFSKDGFKCKHNLNYWENNSYLGLGPSAVSYSGGLRKKLCFGVKEYIEKIKAQKDPIMSKEKLSPKKRAMETAALKIRTKEGIDFKWFKAYTGFDFLKLEGGALAKLIGDNLVRHSRQKGVPKGVYLTKKGLLFCDTVSSNLL